MPRTHLAPMGQDPMGLPSLGDLLTARPAGLAEHESWAVLCQAVQALQDLFLADDISGGQCVPLVTPNTLLLSNRGRVQFSRSQTTSAFGGLPVAAHLSGYLAPEYRPGKRVSDTEAEKMWIHGLGETLKRATLTSHAATSRLSGELCRVLADTTRPQAVARASLMYLLDVISEYCKRRQQSRPFSHIVMDLHQEAMASLEMTLDTPWGPPAMPELRTLTRNSSEVTSQPQTQHQRRWMHFRSPNSQKLTREASTSMEDLNILSPCSLPTPSLVARPKSICVPNELPFDFHIPHPPTTARSEFNLASPAAEFEFKQPTTTSRYNRRKDRRNPVQRAASRLYRAGAGDGAKVRECVGPEFVVRAALPSKQFTMPDIKGSNRKTVTVMLLNGQKVDVVCNPNTTTSGQLFELIIQKEHIEENFMLGLSALIAGDFVFLPSDTRICKAMTPNSTSTFMLFMRVRFFLPSLRGIRGTQARHLLYLQLRRSILEHQLPCCLRQLVELNGSALQAEFGDFREREHGTRDYFLLEHYVPETMCCMIEDTSSFRTELIRAHKTKKGLDSERAEEDFITYSQSLDHYGGHFYTATWVLKDNTNRDVWLYISAQGINLYERGPTTNQNGPVLYEMFEWKAIQTLCYSKHYLCILPHAAKLHRSQLKKYKLKMDHKKSYFTFRLASLHHQFFLRLRTEYTSLNALSNQFGIPLKEMKNETNSLYKLEALTNQHKQPEDAETEFKIEFRNSLGSDRDRAEGPLRRAKSIGDFGLDEDVNEDFQNKENESPRGGGGGLVLDSSCLSGFPLNSLPPVGDKRRGVKMGIRAFASNGQRVSRSVEAVNLLGHEELEQLSLQSVSINCSTTASVPHSPNSDLAGKPDVYVLDTSVRSCDNQNFLPNFQETLSDTLLEKLDNFSFADERMLRSVTVKRDQKGSLGMQITEGSDGKVYVQSVIPNGPAYQTQSINRGDQVVAVDGKNLLSLKYGDALSLLKTTGDCVEFILSQLSYSKQPSSPPPLIRVSELRCRMDLSDLNESHLKSVRLERTMNKLKRMSFPNAADNLEKYLTESCLDVSNSHKHPDLSYQKHVRSMSKSCVDVSEKPVVVDLIPKIKYQSRDADVQHPMIAMPRSLGLSRKWRGPVKYPVTPVKKVPETSDKLSSTSDEEQVFI